MGALYNVLAGAAGSDPEIADMHQRQQRSRHNDQRRVARSLARKGALRPGLSEARATDIMWASPTPPCTTGSSLNAGGRPASTSNGSPMP
jgi:hypothetical protein